MMCLNQINFWLIALRFLSSKQVGLKILLNLIFFVLAVVSYLHNSHYVTLTHTHTHVQTLRRWVGKSSHTTNRSRTLWHTAYFAADYTNTFRFRDIHGLLHTPQLSTHNTQLPFASLLRRLCGSADFHPQLRSHSSPLLTTHPTNTTTTNPLVPFRCLPSVSAASSSSSSSFCGVELCSAHTLTLANKTRHDSDRDKNETDGGDSRRASDDQRGKCL